MWLHPKTLGRPASTASPIQNAQFQTFLLWNSSGTYFTILNPEGLEKTLLPLYFRHSNLKSFVRQLNMYGFHKSRKDPSKNIFSHPFFLRGHPQLLHLVKRKIKIEENREEEVKVTPPSPLPKKKNSENVDPFDVASKKSLRSFTLIIDAKEHNPTNRINIANF
jgi:hypothetical protein